MNIILIGYRGSGKTTAGRMLADRLGWPFVDTDALIEQRSGMTIRRIFADQAEEGFRDLESEIVAEVARLDQHVVSTGGGALLREGHAAALHGAGRLVWLTASAEILWQRIVADTHRFQGRPQIDRARSLEQVREGLTLRVPVYSRWADAVVDTSARSTEAVVDEILALVGLG